VCVEPEQVSAEQTVALAYSWQAPFPSQRPFGPQVDGSAAVHCAAIVGATPAGTGEQVPGLAASAQDMQVPVHALAQHTPWAQMPELHSPADAHVFPIGFLVQSLLMQKYDVAQSVSDEQLVLQTFAATSHSYSLHDEVVAAAQVPVPVQARGAEYVVPVQLASAHTVPPTYLRQAPLPSQVPSLPQVEAPPSTHCEAGVGIWPDGTFAQVPALP
jgi:hypothetical protein